MIDFKSIMEDYQPNDDIMCEDDDLVAKLKKIIFEKLSEIDRRVIILYCEMQSQRKVAKMLGVSASTVNILLKRIREDIVKWL